MNHTKRLIPVTLAMLLLVPAADSQQKPGRAKNVIVFLADAGGIPAINAASIVGYGEPQKLFVQSWQNMGLSDTSTASQWVSDSAAGMTAIVTGQKTHNGVLSEGPDTERGKKDGTPLKTILEYAEEHGLSTGTLTNVNIADATPAACYSHVDDRSKFGEIFLQLFNPRFGDGVDVVMGLGRRQVYDGVKELGQDLDAVAKAHGRTIYASLDEAPAADKRPIVVLDRDMDLPVAARKAIQILSANPRGYFLMLEWDTHTDDPERGLQNMVGLDKLVREISGMVNLNETLLLFTADHSFDLRLHGGQKGTPILADFEQWKQEHQKSEPIELKALWVRNSHTGEEVLAAGQGPGSERLRGFFPNTFLFQVMMDAYGWKAGQ